VGGISRVDEGVHALTVRTGGNRGGAGKARLLSLHWSRLELLLSLNWSRLELLLSLNWSRLELSLSLHWSRLELSLSLDWSRLELLSLSWNLLSWLFGCELGSVNVSLKIKMGGVSWVDERIEVCAGNLLLLLLLWLLSYELLLWLLLSPLGRSDWSGWSDRSLLFPDGSSFRLCWKRLRFPSGNLRIEWSALKTVGSLRDVVSLDNPEAVLASGVSDSDGLSVLVDVTVLANPLPVSRRLLPEHRPVLLGEG